MSKKTYNVGDVGPAGGIVFYKAPIARTAISCNIRWKYLEVAPVEFWQHSYFGYQRLGNSSEKNVLVGATVPKLGSGLSNTFKLVRTFGREAHTTPMSREGWSGADYAAAICCNFYLNGYKDWFLPSLDELEALSQNLKATTLFSSPDKVWGWMWSSSELTPLAAYQVHLVSGDSGAFPRENIVGICPVRMFC